MNMSTKYATLTYLTARIKHNLRYASQCLPNWNSVSSVINREWRISVRTYSQGFSFMIIHLHVYELNIESVNTSNYVGY